jgi:hypothetical protein
MAASDEAMVRLRRVMAAHGGVDPVPLAPSGPFAGGGGAASLDDVELNMRSAAPDVRRGKDDEVHEYISARQAEAALRGRAVSDDSDDALHTSCDSSDARSGASDGSGGWSSADCEAFFDEGSAGRPPPARRRRRRGRRRGASSSKLTCFACMWGARPDLGGKDHHIDASAVNQMLRIFDALYGTQDSKHLARLVHQYFVAAIYEPARRKGVDLAMWTTRQIYEHFMTHTLEPRVWVGQEIEALRRDLAVLRRLKYRRQPGATCPEESVVADDRNVKAYLLVQRRILDLHLVQFGKMSFFDPTRGIDFEGAKKGFNPWRNFSTGQ